MFSFSRYISLVLFLLGISWSTISFGAFIPSETIFLTGTSLGSQVAGTARFDIAAYTSGYDYLIPELDTATRTFSGGFYTTKLGWFLLENNTDTVGLDCGTQSLESLTDICILTGTGWGENIGVIQFSGPNARVEYIPSEGVLSGSVWSNAIGSIKLDNIYLPLRPAHFIGMDKLIASHAALLTIDEASKYGLTTDGWNIAIAPTDAASYMQSFSSSDGIFGSVDTTIAGEYSYTIIDPSGSMTTDDRQMKVFPGKMSKTLYTNSLTNLANYCTNEPSPLESICPDGSDLHATYLSGGLGIPPRKTQAVADGNDILELILGVRDTYGNDLSTDIESTLKLEVEVTNEVKRCQILDSFGISSENTNICDVTADLISSPVTYNSNPAFDLSNWSPMSRNPTLSIESIAPTNTGNTLTIENINYRYLSGSIEIHSGTLLGAPIRTNFLPVYSLSGLTIDRLDVGSSSNIRADIVQTGNIVSVTLPKLIHSISIGNGALANSSGHFEPTGSWDCSAFVGQSSRYVGDCAWESGLRGDISPSVGKEDITSLGFTKIWNLVSPLPTIIDPIWFTPVFTYKIGTDSVAYYGARQRLLVDTSLPDPKVNFIGNMGKILDSSYNGSSISTTSESVSNMLNLVRKNTAILSRSRVTYDDVDYVVYNEGNDVILTRALMGEKRSIIALGSNIYITENLTGSNLPPRAIIALADAEGNGGNIVIKNNVRDIDASLVADRALISGVRSGSTVVPYVDNTLKNNQLYIHGVLITQNTVGGGRCPPLVSGCDASTYEVYDLNHFRAGYHDLMVVEIPNHLSASPVAQSHPDSSLVIEYNPALLSDPPPGLIKEVQ